jgi:hypothetical protein
MARPMTPAEKQRFKGYFPNLDVNKAVVTGPATGVYNCISWTLGVTSSWIWPGPTIQDFDKVYNAAGFVRVNSGPIAVWGSSLSAMTHGCISGAGHGPRWESKCGSDLRIEHGLNELVGASYGRVLAYYTKRRAVAATGQSLTERAKKKRSSQSYLSRTEHASLKDEISRIPDDTRKEFEKRYAAWRKTWSDPHLAILSDPAALRYSKEFSDLGALGPEILPLVVEKLAQPAEFFALQLYDALQSHPALRLDTDAEHEQVFEGEQGRAERLVKHWLRK